MGGGGGGGCGMKRGREGMSVHKSHDQAHLLLRMGSLDTTGFPHKRTGVRAITMPIVVSDAWHTADSCVVQNYCSKQYTVTLCYLCRLSCPMFGIPRIIVFCVTMPIVVSDVCRTEDNCIVRIYADCRVQCLVYRV